MRSVLILPVKRMASLGLGLLILVSVACRRLMGIQLRPRQRRDQYSSDTRHAYEGRAVTIVVADQPCTGRATVTSPGLADGCDTVRADEVAEA